MTLPDKESLSGVMAVAPAVPLALSQLSLSSAACGVSCCL
jgi:hypothetical protein